MVQNEKKKKIRKKGIGKKKKKNEKIKNDLAKKLKTP